MEIHSYASHGDRNGVRGELSKGVPVDVRDEQDYTPLAYAVSGAEPDEDMLQLLIASGADVNATVDHANSSPLGLAAGSGNSEIVQVLLDAGANIKFESPKGYTVLINIMYSLHDDEKLVPMAEFLVRNGAEMDCETEYGESPLNVASRLGEFDAVRLLLDAGGDPSPLQWTELMKAVALGTCDDVQRFLDGGGSLDDRDRWDRTPWLLTSFVEDVEKARTLHSAGADVNDRGRGGDTALMYCAARGNADMLHWLVEIGTDIEAVDDAGNTALMLAAQAGETTCVHLLLEAGADPSRKNEYDENAMGMSSGDGRIVVPLRGRPAQVPDQGCFQGIVPLFNDSMMLSVICWRISFWLGILVFSDAGCSFRCPAWRCPTECNDGKPIRPRSM